MLEIQEKTPTRLVIKLTHGLNVSTLVLDKSTGRARFERAVLFFKRKPLEVALDDIQSITAPPSGAHGGASHVPLVELKSGGKFEVSDAVGQAEAVEAVGQMSTFLEMTPNEAGVPTEPGLPPVIEQPAAGGPSPARRWVIRGAWLVAGAAFLIAGGSRIASMFSLPSCEDERTRKSITEIFEEKKVKLDTLADVRTVTAERSEKTCRARADVPGGFFNLDYRVDWDGWSPRITITRAEAMAKIEPARLGEIRRAVSDFLERARDSHTTGRPPRQTDAAVMVLIDKVFDTSDFDGATLAASDIGRALDWFSTGDQIGVVYMLAGTGVADITKLPNDAKTQERTHRNVADFAPEFARYLDFEVKLAGAMADAALKRSASAPDEVEQPQVKREFAEVRSVLSDAMTGALTSLAYDGLSDEWRRDRLAVLTEAAPKAAKFLTPEQARALRQHALNVVGYVKNSFVQDTLKAFADQVATQQ